MKFEAVLAAVLPLVLTISLRAQAPSDTAKRLETLEKEAERLKTEIETLRRETRSSTPQAPKNPFVDDVYSPNLEEDERENVLQARPEIFIQTRFARILVPQADPEDTHQNFQLSRIETRWAGRLSPRVGAGLELQLHPPLEGAPEEIVNDAFVEFYPANSMTVRAGQFIKPFGFDIQQSSSEREYPERTMVVGYFFPGQRDRGLLLSWKVDKGADIFDDTHFQVALLNGNRFFNDSDSHLDTVIRVRRLFPQFGLAVGASGQFGSQILPPGVAGSTRVRIGGFDVQYTFRRVGVRLEWIRGTQPSTLVSLEPEFTTQFTPGAETTGLAAALLVNLTDDDRIYGRYDRLTGDPMGTGQVHATDIGYQRFLGSHARVAVDYQWKNRATLNDDEVNTKLQVTLGIVF